MSHENIAAVLVMIVLGLLAALHFYWGFGGRWPGHDDRSLVEMVVGRTRDMRAPNFLSCLFVTLCAPLAAAPGRALWRRAQPTAAELGGDDRPDRILGRIRRLRRAGRCRLLPGRFPLRAGNAIRSSQSIALLAALHCNRGRLHCRSFHGENCFVRDTPLTDPSPAHAQRRQAEKSSNDRRSVRRDML